MTFAVIVLLVVVYYGVEAGQLAEKNAEPPAEITNLVAKQQATLTSYRWVDRDKQIAAIPIRRAMELVVADLSQKANSPKDRTSQNETRGHNNGR